MHDHLPLVCFIVCDNGPATHFAKTLLVKGNLRIDIYASGLVLAKLQGLNLSDGIRLFHFILDELNTEEEAQKLPIELLDNFVMEGAQTIIVDIANKFDTKVQEAFNKLDISSHNIRFWYYYANPEEYVPGGYSNRSREMIKLSQNILFANMNLVKNDSNIYLFTLVEIIKLIMNKYFRLFFLFFHQ